MWKFYDDPNKPDCNEDLVVNMETVDTITREASKRVKILKRKQSD